MFRKALVKAALLGMMVCGLCISSMMAQQEAPHFIQPLLAPTHI
jgi:hypothetical protein